MYILEPWIAGVDVILDVVGAPYLNKNLEALALDGRIFIIFQAFVDQRLLPTEKVL
jgi:NADPH:quinone reductase-like Zn-dependent oxidoreductase